MIRSWDGGRVRIRSFFNGGQANLYVYSGNDPVNSTDPSGRASLGACLFDQAEAAYECAHCAIEHDGSSCFFCAYFSHASNENCPRLLRALKDTVSPSLLFVGWQAFCRPV